MMTEWKWAITEWLGRYRVVCSSRHDTIRIIQSAEEFTKNSNESVEFIPDHVTHESLATMNIENLIDRAETIMRLYPWIVLTRGAGPGYVASRSRRLL